MTTETVMLRPHAVRALLRAASFDPADNTIEIVWTTGAAVQRYDWDGSYTETLVVTPQAVRMGRLNGGIPFLNAHSSWDLADIIGRTVPGSASVADGEGTCRVKLSEDPAKAGIVADIRAGVIADVSVGYIVHQMVRTEAQDGQCASCLVTDWEPIEISAVPIPADPDAKVRASPSTAAAERGETHACIVTRAAPIAPTIDPESLTRAARAAETHRVQGILAVTRSLGLGTGPADLAISNATSLPDFRAIAIDAVATRTVTLAADVGPLAAPALTEGQPDMTTAAPAAPATEAARAAAVSATVDVGAIRTAETARIQGIITTARKLGLPTDSADRAIADNVPLEAFRTLAIDAAAERQAPASFNVLPSGDAGTEHRTYAQARVERPKGTDATRLMIALAATRGSRGDAAAFVGHHYGQEGALLARALSTSVGSAGGFLVPVEMSAEIIELLRPASTVMALNPQILPMPAGNLFVPRATSGASANYVGENQPALASQPGFGGVQLSAKKLVALVPISNDMIKFASPATDGFVRGDMIKAIAQRADLAFLRGNGSAFSPRGLRSFAANPALGGNNVVAANPTVNLQNAVNDLGKLELALEGANIVMDRPGWIMSPRTKTYLMNLRDGLGNAIYEKEMLAGMLRGKPFKVTTQIPNTLAALAADGVTQTVDGSEIYLADFAEVLIGEAYGLELEVFSGGSYVDANGAMQSGISNDQTVMRAIVQHDMGMRQEAAAAVLTGVRWFS